MKQVILWAIPVAIIGAAVSLLVMFAGLPDPAILKTQYPVVQYDASNEEAHVVLRRSRPPDWVSLSDVSKIAVSAIVISEDSAFYQHEGYDPDEIRKAIQKDWEERRFARGASTITQQVVKNVFLENKKSLIRKAKEFYLALHLDKEVGKHRVLEIYLNVAEWGEGIYGIREASRFYFSKSPSELTAKEGAFLAMLLPSPIRYGQSFRDHKLTDYASQTVESILRKLAQANYLTEEDLSAEISRPLGFEAEPAITQGI